MDPIGNGSYKRRYEYLDAAKVSLISFIEKHLDHFLVIFIAKPPFFGEKDEGKHLGLSEGLTTNIFSSYDDFEQWLRGLNIDELEISFYKAFMLSKNNTKINLELRNYFIKNYSKFSKKYKNIILKNFFN